MPVFFCTLSTVCHVIRVRSALYYSLTCQAQEHPDDIALLGNHVSRYIDLTVQTIQKVGYTSNQLRVNLLTNSLLYKTIVWKNIVSSSISKLGYCSLEEILIIWQIYRSALIHSRGSHRHCSVHTVLSHPLRAIPERGELWDYDHPILSDFRLNFIQ